MSKSTPSHCQHITCKHTVAIIRERMRKAISEEAGTYVTTFGELAERAVSFDKLLTLVTYEANALMWEHWKELGEFVSTALTKGEL